MGVGVSAGGAGEAETVLRAKVFDCNGINTNHVITEALMLRNRLWNNLVVGATREIGMCLGDGFLTDFTIYTFDNTTTQDVTVGLSSSSDDITFGDNVDIGIIPAGAADTVTDFTALAVPLDKTKFYKFTLKTASGGTGNMSYQFMYVQNYGAATVTPDKVVFYDQWLQIPTATPNAYFSINRYLYAFSNIELHRVPLCFSGTLSKIRINTTQDPASGTFTLRLYKNGIDVWNTAIPLILGDYEFEPNIDFARGDLIQYKIEKSLSASNAYFKLSTGFSGVTLT